MPSLLSMKYLGYEGKDEKVAENTRRLILSRANPYYYEGSKAAGIGSPHTPVNYIWHIALAMEGLTCESAEAKLGTAGDAPHACKDGRGNRAYARGIPRR